MADRNNTDPNNGVGILIVKPRGTTDNIVFCAVDLPALIPRSGQPVTPGAGYVISDPLLVGPNSLQYTYNWDQGDGISTGYSQDPVNNQSTIFLPPYFQGLDLSSDDSMVTVTVQAQGGSSAGTTKTGQGTVSTIKFKGDVELPPGMSLPSNSVKVYSEDNLGQSVTPEPWQIRPIVLQSITQSMVYCIVTLALTDGNNEYNGQMLYNMDTSDSGETPPFMSLLIQPPQVLNNVASAAVTLVAMFYDNGPGANTMSGTTQIYPWNSIRWQPIGNPYIVPYGAEVKFLSPYNLSEAADVIRNYPNVVKL